MGQCSRKIIVTMKYVCGLPDPDRQRYIDRTEWTDDLVALQIQDGVDNMTIESYQQVTLVSSCVFLDDDVT